MANISKMCTYHVFIIEKQKSVFEAALMMKKHGIKKLIVVEQKGHDYFPIGFVTSFDLVLNVIADEINAKKIRIEKIIPQKSLFFAKENQQAEEILKVMADYGIRQMPVIDEDNKLVGMASIDNIILFMASCKEFSCLKLAAEAIAAQIPENFNY